jgi:hypothetical protein
MPIGYINLWVPINAYILRERWKMPMNAKAEEGKEVVKEIFDLDKDTDEDFRRTAYETKGYKKGVLKESFTEAVKAWVKEQKRLRKEYKEIEQGRK